MQSLRQHILVRSMIFLVVLTLAALWLMFDPSMPPIGDVVGVIILVIVAIIGGRAIIWGLKQRNRAF